MDIPEIMTTNVSENATVKPNFQAMHPNTIEYMRCQSLVIIILNVACLIILASKKSKFPAVYWLQIICLAFNDFLVGIANFTISFLDYPFFKESNINCAIVIVFLFSSQSASLYNIFGISIHRYVVLKKSNMHSNLWKHRHTLLCAAVAWTVSLILCSLPVMMFNNAATFKEENFSVQTLFGANVKTGMIILMGSFIVPLLFTNVLYIVLFYVLRSMWQSVKPSEGSRNSEVGSLCSMTALFNGTEICRLSSRSMKTADICNQSNLYEKLTAQPEKLQSIQTSKCSTYPMTNVVRSKSFNNSTLKPKILSQNKQRSLFLVIPKRQETAQLFSVKPLSQPSTSNDIATLNSTMNHSKTVITDHHENSSFSLASSIQAAQCQLNIPRTLLRQRKAYTLLGIILLFLNIFTWPAIVALLLTSMIHSISIGRETLLPLFTTICVNSVVNPILYTATISEFRSVICDLFLNIYEITKRQ